MSERVIIIHSLEQAVTALKAARELDRPVTLASPPGAAAYTGALWFREVVKQAEREVPEAEVSSILDCGDKPGLVMAAFRQGVLRVRFTGPKAAAAQPTGARPSPKRPARIRIRAQSHAAATRPKRFQTKGSIR